MKGSVTEKRPGVWQIMVDLPRDPITDKRRRKWATVKGSKRKAQFELQKLLVEAQEAKARSSSASVEHVIKEWFASARTELTPQTVKGYEWRIRTQILPRLGATPLDEINAAQLDRFYRELLAAGSSPATIRQTHAIVRRALDQAVRWGWLDRNPAAMATPPRSTQTQMVAPSVEQLSEILREARASHPQWEAMIAFAAISGMRRGEICALRWSDFADGRVHVQRSLTYTPATGVIEGPTKTRQTRRVALDRIGMAVVEKQMASLKAATEILGILPVSDPFLFFSEPDGGAPTHPDSISKIFRKLADAHGWRDLHFHSLRHFTATQLIAAGVDIRTVSGRLGHSDPSVTLRVYSHMLEANDREAATIMGRLVHP